MEKKWREQCKEKVRDGEKGGALNYKYLIVKCRNRIITLLLIATSRAH